MTKFVPIGGIFILLLLVSGIYAWKNVSLPHLPTQVADTNDGGTHSIPATTSDTTHDRNLPPSPSATDPDSIIIAPGREFAADSYVHTPLPNNAPLDPKSDLWVANLRRQIAQYYGTAGVNIDSYTPPIWVVGVDQPTVRVKVEHLGEPDYSYGELQPQWEAVPLPDNFKPSEGTDEEAVVYRPATGTYWEFWLMQKTGKKITDSAGRQVDEWQAGWGGRMDTIATNPGYWVPGASGINYGTQASGLPLLSSVMTIKEQRRGVINHPLDLVIVEARQGAYSLPAQRTDGGVDDVNAIPEGTIFRLPFDLNLDAIDMDPYARMIAKTVQKYGMIVSDTGGSITLRAENPAGRYAVDPYYGPGGIMRCPHGHDEPICWPFETGRLRGFPWDKLQALKTTMMVWDSRTNSYQPE